jgi:hypothetical protein
MQYFKGDDQELKVEASAAPILDLLSSEKSSFFAGAYDAAGLGGVIYDADRSPLANAIDRDIFIASFAEIFTAFTVAGSFESYISVFQKIFGSSVYVHFTVPAVGKLNIDIIASTVDLYNFVARSIVGNAYVFDEVVDYTPDNVAFQLFKGFQSQYELEQMLFEMVPAGIFTTITLTL